MYQGQAPAYSELSSLYSAKRLYALCGSKLFKLNYIIGATVSSLV